MNNEAENKPKSITELRAECIRFLSGNRQINARDWLTKLADSPDALAPLDAYGEGTLINGFEREMATLLGKEAAVFVVKGVIAQQMALRVWTDRAGVPSVVIHPMSHIDYIEKAAYERLHHLKPIRLGNHSPFSLKELKEVRERIGVVTVELPLREVGYKLPKWEELTAISDWCKEKDIRLHFDGARLWEAAPYYGRSYAEIAALADSVYVSFYKGLGGLGGCVLAGPADFIEETKLWKTRHGGNLFRSFPFIISARQGIEENLPKIEGYCRRAREIARLLAEIPGVQIAPDQPHTNAFQLYLPGELQRLKVASLKIAETEKIWLFGGFNETALPNLAMTEISVGGATEDFTNAEIVELVQRLISDPAAG
jgi:threonine aldolase